MTGEEEELRMASHEQLRASGVEGDRTVGQCSTQTQS